MASLWSSLRETCFTHLYALRDSGQEKYHATMMEFSERLAHAMKLRDISQAELARKMDTAWSTVDRWLKGSRPHKITMTRLAYALGVASRWLEVGDGPLERLEASEPTFAELVESDSKTPPIPPGAIKVNYIPLISWAHAGEATSYEELPRDQQEMLPTICMEPGSFALSVHGDSMQPRIDPGDIVVVMPEKEPRTNCLVVAKLKNDGVILRRIAFLPGNRIRLSPYNPTYSVTEHSPAEFHWIYPIHSTVRREWN